MSAATTTVHYVSCLVHNPADPISPDQRLAWLRTLFSYGPLPMTLYADLYYASQISEADHPGLTVIRWSPDDSDTAHAIQGRVKTSGPIALPARRNEAKDTQFFLTLMHAKAELVSRTMGMHSPAIGSGADALAHAAPQPFYAFLDAGIVKIFKDVRASVERLRTLRPSAAALAGRVLVPGCWTPCTHTFESLAAQICWVFCGGFFLLEASTACTFKAAQRRALQHFIDTGRLTWEVNTWVQMLRDEGAPRFAWFSADHNDSMVIVPAEFLECGQAQAGGN
jgi:hypothetical protein